MPGVIKEFTFEAAHRLPNHRGKCRHIHGHSYKLQVRVDGTVRNVEGSSDEGMVLDFGDVSAVWKQELEPLLDHHLLLWIGDPVIQKFASVADVAEFGILPFNFIPTAENIANWIADVFTTALNPEVDGHRPYGRIRVQLWETATSSATA